MAFCRECGKEVLSEWATCPFCSETIGPPSEQSDEDFEFILIGVDGSSIRLEGFEGDHNMQDVRNYSAEHFPNICWAKGTGEEGYAISIDTGPLLSWDEVEEKTLDELEIRDGSMVRLCFNIVFCGGDGIDPKRPPPPRGIS